MDKMTGISFSNRFEQRLSFAAFVFTPKIGGVSMNTVALEYFLEVCSTLSFSRAAETLYLSPQGVSKAVRSLEEELGRPLFSRTAHGLALTPYGKELRISAQRILKETERLRHRFETLDAPHCDWVRLGVAMGTAQAMGRDFLEKLRAIDPGAPLLLSDGWDLLCEEEVLSERCDLALICGPADPRSFCVTTLLKGDMCAFLREGHPLCSRTFLTMSDLKEERFILTNVHYRLYHQFLAACHNAGFKPEITGTTINVGASCQSCPDERIVGISAFPIERHAHYDGLHLLPIRDPAFGWEVDLIAKRGRALSPQAAAAKEQIRALSAEIFPNEAAPLSE